MHIFLRVVGLVSILLGALIAFQAGGDAIRLLVGTVLIVGGVLFLALAQILIEIGKLKPAEQPRSGLTRV